MMTLAGCLEPAGGSDEQSQSDVVVEKSVATVESPSADVVPTVPAARDLPTSAAAPGTYLQLNQWWLEGLSTEELDLDDVDAVFWEVFSGLPDQVVVYPSENYYYFALYVDKRQIWGNIRLAAGRRENGVLSFAYFEFKESPYVTQPRLLKSKFFTESDGLVIDELDRFTFLVKYNGKDVTFNLHKLSQEQPKLFRLGDDELSLMRTFDESGYQFFLIFNTSRNYFLWVLNEEEPVADTLQRLTDDLIVGRRSGFVFLVDDKHDDRKILVGIRGANATVNNYYDGPFDQLADNYVDETNVSQYMIQASPDLEGRIDKYGYFTDRESGSSRLAISPYYVYFSDAALNAFVAQVKSAPDPYYAISRKGLPETPTPFPTRFPTPYPTPFPTPFPTFVPSPTPTPGG